MFADQTKTAGIERVVRKPDESDAAAENKK